MRLVSRRRSILALLASALLLLAACGGGDGGGDAGPTDSAARGIRLVTPGRLTTCTHLPYPPFQFERDGKVIGFDVDIIDLVAKEIGVAQTIVDTPFETIKTGADLNAGKCDVAAAGMTITEERSKNLDFSSPYFEATQTLMVRSGSSIRGLSDLVGRKLGAQSGTTGEDYAKGHAPKGVNIVSFESSEAELTGLISGQVDAIIQDKPVVSLWLKQHPGYEIALDFDTGEQYGFAVKKGGNPKLLEVINQVIARTKSDGTYDALYEKWLGIKPPRS